MPVSTIEIVIERSTAGEGKTTYRWSAWFGDQLLEHGQTYHAEAIDCEVEAIVHCWRTYRVAPNIHAAK